MGFLDNSTVTVDAILTKRGREILANGGDLNITKFALSDEEVDYTLYDVTHPNGTDSYGAVIENMSLLEATPNRTDFRSFLVDQSLAGLELKIDQLSYNNVDTNTIIGLNPSTPGITENYTFIIENTNIVKFDGGGGQTVQIGNSVTLKSQSITTAATTTVSVTGNVSGLSKVVTIAVIADPTSNNSPEGPKNPTLSSPLGTSGATGGGGTYSG